MHFPENAGIRKTLPSRVTFITLFQPSLFGKAPIEIPHGDLDGKRTEKFESQLLRAFSFFLNEQTTPRALWNTHHMVQSQAKNRPMQRPQVSQSPTFCMVSEICINEVVFVFTRVFFDVNAG